MDWVALAAISQTIECIVIGIGLFLVFKQIKQIGLESKLAKWEALRWAMELTPRDDFVNFVRLLGAISEKEDPSGNIHIVGMDDEPVQKSMNLMASLEIVMVAMEDGYVDKEVYLAGRSTQLVALAGDNIRGKLAWKILVGTNESVRNLIDEAIVLEKRKWEEKGNEGQMPNLSIDSLADWFNMKPKS